MAQPAAGWDRRSQTDLVNSSREATAREGRLLILLLFSAISWGIILFKTWQFRRAARQTATFLDVFRKSSKFSEVQAVCRTLGTARSSGSFRPAMPS